MRASRKSVDYAVFALPLLMLAVALYFYHARPVTRHFEAELGSEHIMLGSFVSGDYASAARKVHAFAFAAAVIGFLSSLLLAWRCRPECLLLALATDYLFLLQAGAIVNWRFNLDNHAILMFSV